MVQASYDYIDALQGVLVHIASYYSTKQFSGRSMHEFFCDVIASRFEWHRVHAEPHGPGTGGTIVNVICSGSVMADIERMVEDMVMSLLVGYNDNFDYKEWSLRWKGESSNKSLSPDGLTAAGEPQRWAGLLATRCAGRFRSTPDRRRYARLLRATAMSPVGETRRSNELMGGEVDVVAGAAIGFGAAG